MPPERAWLRKCAPPIGAVLAIHGVLLIGLPLSGVSGYGDLPYFYRLAALAATGKLPFFHYWVEYPPLAPWLSVLFYALGGGREHAFVYFWVIVLALADAAVVGAVLRLGRLLGEGPASVQRGWWYVALGFPFVMGWWNMDLLALAFWMWGLVWLFEQREGRAALFVALGVLTKVFPLLTLPLVWKTLPRRRAVRFTLLVVGLSVAAWLPFALLNPGMTRASLLSQWSKGSSQTVWALLDGNLRTGLLGSVDAHLDPARALQNPGHPARLDPRLTLLFFGGVGLLAFWRARLTSVQRSLAFLGLTWGVFLLWSPAWSPQWTLYLAPLLLLVFPLERGWLMAFVLGLASLLEWPVLLSRGEFRWLWITTPLRTAVLALITLAFWQQVFLPAEEAA